MIKVSRHQDHKILWAIREFLKSQNFPWAHLALAESYQLRTYQDKDQAVAHLKTFMKRKRFLDQLRVALIEFAL